MGRNSNNKGYNNTHKEKIHTKTPRNHKENTRRFHDNSNYQFFLAKKDLDEAKIEIPQLLICQLALR